MNDPVVLPDFSSFGGQELRGLESPEEATAATQALLTEDRNAGEPTIDDPGQTHVRLERGIRRLDTWYRDAEVRELTGADEEAIAAAGSSSFRVFETLLLRGVRSIGGEPMDRKVAAELLIGDRELLVMGIRRATFGPDLEFEALPCSACGGLVDLTVPLTDIPTVRLEDPERVEFDVPLRRGAVATVRLPTGEDQAAVMAVPGGNAARQDSELLARCVLRVRQDDGTVTRRPAPTALPMSARKAIMAFLVATQPGPRYADYTWVHDECGEEVSLPVSLATLFRGM
ncbi:hypothetical protein AB0M10_15505 [Streptomyces sp. NPDC051840]|uniref:T4 family baseplate hub assembly chaperone n=1 Tax=Streptomyces sp. NPDC051840 TaxID=3154752 RepID=UPI0034188501